MPKPVVAQPARKNQYGGKCHKCGAYIEAEAGLLVKVNGRWATEHPGECPPVEAKVEQVEAPEGMHRLDDGTIYKVQKAHHGSGRNYAKRLVVHEGLTVNLQRGSVKGTGDAEFVYDAGAIRKLSTATLMSLEDAKAFGVLYGICCNCAAILTDEKSIAAGIGSVCARKGYWT